MTATLSHVPWQVQSKEELKLHYLNSCYEGENEIWNVNITGLFRLTEGPGLAGLAHSGSQWM